MPNRAIPENLLFTLAEHYEKDPGEFCRVSKDDLASSLVRQTMAELRNEGYLEEEVRGVIRFTRRGYQAYRAGTPLVHHTSRSAS